MKGTIVNDYGCCHFSGYFDYELGCAVMIQHMEVSKQNKNLNRILHKCVFALSLWIMLNGRGKKKHHYVLFNIYLIFHVINLIYPK